LAGKLRFIFNQKHRQKSFKSGNLAKVLLAETVSRQSSWLNTDIFFSPSCEKALFSLFLTFPKQVETGLFF
jgi:hypothetical protein